MIKKRSRLTGKAARPLSHSLSYPSVSKQSVATFHTEEHTFTPFLHSFISHICVSVWNGSHLTTSAAIVIFLICWESFCGTCSYFSGSKPSYFLSNLGLIISEFFCSRTPGPWRWDSLRKRITAVKETSSSCREEQWCSTPSWFTITIHSVAGTLFERFFLE